MRKKTDTHTLSLSFQKKGTMHLAVSKVLSVHLSSLYPLASADVDLLREMPLIQISALVGLGLLYMVEKDKGRRKA